MKQFIFLSLFSFIVAASLGQTKTKDSLTAQHINIAGTKVSMIPPDGFIKAINFFGLQQSESGSSIMVLEIPGPFSETSKGFTKEGLLSKGIELKETKKLTVNQLPAVFITGEQNANGIAYTKYILCFGSENETIIINGAVPNNLPEIAKVVKAAMLTSFYEADKKLNPFELIDYSLDLEKSKLQFAKSPSNSIILTTDGNIPTKSTDETVLIIAKSFSKKVIEDRKLFCINRLKQMPIEITKIDSTKEITIDGVSGYKIIASAKNTKTNAAEKICQVILFSDELYYLFFGSTNQNFDDNINHILTIIKTFKRK